MALFSFPPLLDGDPQETRQQELGGLHGALEGEQISEREERHHPLLSGDELSLYGQDDHPQGQTEHGQRLDAALNPPPPKNKKHTTTSRRPELSSTSHSLLLLYFTVISATGACTLWAPPFFFFSVCV